MAMRTQEAALGVQSKAVDALLVLLQTPQHSATAREVGAGHSLVLAMRVHGASERLQERGCLALHRVLDGLEATDDLKVAAVESCVDAMARFGHSAAVQLAAARTLAAACAGDVISQTHAASCGAVEGCAGAMAVRAALLPAHFAAFRLSRRQCVQPLLLSPRQVNH